MRWFKRILLALAALAVSSLMSGWIWQCVAERQDDDRYPPPGELFAVQSGLRMHLHCQGHGSPTVIVEQGIGGPSVDWSDINGQMARLTRVCDYDRAGMGYSEPAFKPTRAADVADNLHSLLQEAKIEDDIVFVAWSAGGLYAKEYYRRFPERVKGMVLVDSTHEQTLQRMPPQPGNQQHYAKLMRKYYLAQFGWLRLTGEVEAQYAQSDLQEQDRGRLVAFFLKSHAYRTLVDEGRGLDEDLALGAPPPNLRDLPLVVIAEGKPRHPYMRDNLARWHELQQDLANLSTRGTLVIAENSAHFVHRTEPELILRAVEEVLRSVRAGPGTTP